MQCPVCDVALSISSREGVEIDFCPQCRGVWLDRGELDKVIERASAMVGGGGGDRYEERRGYDRDRDRERSYDRDRDRDRHHDDDRRRYGDDDYKYGKKKKRRGFLDDLFDFD
jgi:Zn-finger nucleic acid-binding protein